MQPRKDEGKHRMAPKRLSPTILWQQRPKVVVHSRRGEFANLLGRESGWRERERQQTKRSWSVCSLLPTGWKQRGEWTPETEYMYKRDQSTCPSVRRVHPRYGPLAPLLCSIMGVMQGLEANQLH